MKNFKKTKSGFTLIEIMVVVGIISVLSAVLFANFSDARKITRDKARTTTLKEVQLALEFYKAQNGSYPAAGCGATTGQFAGPGPGNGVFRECAVYITDLVPDFIAVLPKDPLSETQTNKGFYYQSDGNSYKLMAYDVVETLIITSHGDEFARCPAASGCTGGLSATTYAVYSAGAETW